MTEDLSLDSEFLGQEGANVTGFSRWKQHTVLEMVMKGLQQQASKSNAEVGTIFEQIYRPWNGTYKF